MLELVKLSQAEHKNYLAKSSRVSFLQTAAWGELKTGWKFECLGWRNNQGETVGVALVLYKSVPLLKKYSLAYIPEGPVIDWQGDLGSFLLPLKSYLKQRNVFLLKIGPRVVENVWSAENIKAGIADSAVLKISDLTADQSFAQAGLIRNALQEFGFKQETTSAAFGDVQPRFTFELELSGKTDDQLLMQMNQQWRRNIKKSESEGVKVRIGTKADLSAFHQIYLETAKRDGFSPRSLDYFEKYFDAFNQQQPDSLRLYVAEHQGVVVAANLWVHINERVWYAYGASSTAGRELRPSNAVQWQMIRDAREVGADIYDLRGITATLNQLDPTVGLINFKVGLGGRAIQWMGEFDLVLNKPIAIAYALARRFK